MNRNNDPKVTFESDDKICAGRTRLIRYAVDELGVPYVRAFILSLLPSERAKIHALIQRLADIGQIHNEQQFKKEQGNVFAFKAGQVRIACFLDGGDWFLTNGFKKKKSKWPSAEMEKCETIRTKHMNKVAASPTTSKKP